MVAGVVFQCFDDVEPASEQDLPLAFGAACRPPGYPAEAARRGGTSRTGGRT